MTPKEKAVELYSKYEQLGRDFTRGVSMHEFAKQCTLIAVDEILNTGPLKMIDWGEIISDKPYWQDVKNEIEAL